MFRENENRQISNYAASSAKEQFTSGSVLDVQIRKLQSKIIELEKDKENLKNELDKLNENTIVESMNDMKSQFDEFKKNSINIDEFDNLKEYYNRHFEISKSIKTINTIMIDNLMEFKYFASDIESSVIQNKINRYIDKTLHYYQLIDDISSRYDGDDFIDPRFSE